MRRRGSDAVAGLLLALAGAALPICAAAQTPAAAPTLDFHRELTFGPIRADLGLQDGGELALVATGSEGGYIERWSERVGEGRFAAYDCGAYFRRQAKYDFDLDASLSADDDDADNVRLGLRLEFGGALGQITRTLGCERPLGPNVALRPVEGRIDGDTPLVPAQPGDGSLRFNFGQAHDLALILPFVDYSYRTQTAAEDDSGERIRISQQLAGAGIGVYWVDRRLFKNGWVNLYPRLIAGYYRSIGSKVEGAPTELPDGLLDDHFAVAASVQFRLPTLSKFQDLSPVLLDLDLRYSRAVSGGDTDGDGWMRTLKLIYEAGGLPGGATPALIYRSGVDRGFEYDAELLLAIGWRLVR